MSTAPPPPPNHVWPPGPPRREPSTVLGVERWMWALAFAPVLPSAVLALILPAFIAPLLDGRASVAGLPLGVVILALLPVLTLIATRIHRTLGAIVLALTFAAGVSWAILGPAIILILIGTSPGPPS